MANLLDSLSGTLIEAARQPFLILDGEMKVVAANPSFCRTFHTTQEEVRGRRLDEIRGWDDTRLKEALQGLSTAMDSFDDIEVERDFPAVGLRALRMNARTLAADLGPGQHTLLSIEDITESRRMAAELKLSETRYRRLFESAKDGILILDAVSGRIEQANPYLADILGRDASDLVGRELWEMGFFGNAQAGRQAFLRLQDEGHLRFEDLPLETRDGRRIEVELVCNLYPVGGRDMIQCNIRDVSDRKRAEAAQREAEGRLRQSLKMEAIGTLAGGVAHEYNNLLTAINGFAALALSYAGMQGPLGGYLAEIREAGEKAAKLTRQLLAYSRQQVLEPKPVDINELVAKVGRLLEGLVGSDIELVDDLDPGLGRVRADPGQIEQALLNLAVNARDSLPGGGRITFRTRMVAQVGDEGGIVGLSASARPHALVTISDSGAGMDRTAQERIFDPFFASRGKKGIDGLALSMVQGIIAQSGGQVKVESAPGRGTSFKIYLPLAEEGERKP